MSTVENKALSRRLIEEMVNKGNVAVAEALVAEDWRSLNSRPGQAPGRQGLFDNLAIFRTAFPDLEYTIEDMVAEDNKVASALVMRGTHQGVFMGIPPTGKRVTVRGLGIDTFSGGQCTESRILFDMLSLMQQLGVIPASGAHSPATA